MPPSITVSGLAQVAISVTDLSRAIEFYRDRLGLQLLFEAPPQLAFFQVGATRLMLTGQPGEAESHPILYFQVDDVETAFARLAEIGVPTLSNPHCIARVGPNDIWLAMIKDPDGHPVGLMGNRPVN